MRMLPGPFAARTSSTAGTTHGLLLLLLLSLFSAQVWGRFVLDPRRPHHHHHHHLAERAAVDGTYSIAGEPNAGSSVYVQVFGDGDPALGYSDGWNVRTSSSLNLTDGMEHVTVTPSSTLQFLFRGTALSLIGTTGPNHGRFSVLIDHTLHKGLSSKTGTAITGQTLFNVQGLQDTDEHYFELTHEDERGVELDVDAVVVWGDANTTPSPTPVTATTLACVSGSPTTTGAGHKHKGHHDKSFSLSISDQGGIGFPFMCPTATSQPGGGLGSSSISVDVSSLKTNVPSTPTPSLSTSLSNPDSAGTKSTNITPVVVGGIIGGVAGAGAIVALTVLAFKKMQGAQPLFGFVEETHRSPSNFGDSSGSSVNSHGSAASMGGGGGGGGGGGRGMMEAFGGAGAAGGVAGALVAGNAQRRQREENPFEERGFDVARPARTMAHPSAQMGLSPYFQPGSPGAVGRPTHQPMESYATNHTTSSGTSYSGPNDIKHIALATGRSTPASDGHGGSGSSSGHGRPRVKSRSTTIDPYLNRRSSILSVRNPDIEPDSPIDSEEMPYPKSPMRITEGYLYDPSVRESLASQPSHSQPSGHSHTGSTSSAGGDAWLAAPSPSHQAARFRSPNAVAFQPELVAHPPPPSSASASVFGPSSYRAPISTISEGDEYWHSGRSSAHTVDPRARESYPDPHARESYPSTMAARPSFPASDGDNVDPFVGYPATPKGASVEDSDAGSLRPPLRQSYRQSVDNASSVGTPSSVQQVHYTGYPWTGGAGRHNSGSSVAS